MSKETNFPSFTDLGAKLIADPQGTYRRLLLKEISNTLVVKEKSIAKGLPPDDKLVADGELQALEAASRIINLFWHSIHTKPQPSAS